MSGAAHTRRSLFPRLTLALSVCLVVALAFAGRVWAQGAPEQGAPGQGAPGQPVALREVPLTVNGVEVAGATTELVPGTTYAPAAAFAGALGAPWRFDAEAGRFSLEFGGRLLSLQSFPTPEGAAGAAGSLVVDGQARPAPGGVVVDGQLYLPVKGVAGALGGRTAQLALPGTAPGRVTVVFPRPLLTRVVPPGVWGRAERFVLHFSAPVVVEPFFEPSLRVVRFRFLRAALGGAGGEMGGERFSGAHFSDAAFVPDVGYLDFNITLRAGQDYSVFNEPVASGQRVVIDLFASGGAEGGVGGTLPALILDPTEGTQALARELRRMLAARGVDVQLSWTAGPADPAVRMRAGMSAPFFVTLSRAPLGPARFNLYYLSIGGVLGAGNGGVGVLPGPASAPLRTPSPDARAALGDAARARLAALLPNLEMGERAAQRLGAGLEARTELRRGEVMGAPLFALAGAAGRGVMLELSTEVLTTPGLVAALADSLVATLSSDAERVDTALSGAP